MVLAVMQSATPNDLQREQVLVERLDEVKIATNELQSALRFVNDVGLRTHAEALVTTIFEVLATHREGPSPRSVADDLAGLMSAARALPAPAQDTELGRTSTLQGLRTAEGLIIVALGDALDAAQALGLYPRGSTLLQEIPIEVQRADNEGPFRQITERLEEVVKKLDELDDAGAKPTTFPQQTGLLNFYIGAMRAQVDLAKLHLTVGGDAIDFSALARSVEVVGELTRDFVATVRAWIGRVSDTVFRIAEELRVRVHRLALRTSAAARRIARKRAVSVQPDYLELSFDPSDPECIARVEVTVFRQGTRVIERSFPATSIRVRVQTNSSEIFKNVLVYITKIEKRLPNGEWQDSHSPDTRTTWIDTDDITTDISPSSAKYANIVHIEQPYNKITIWKNPILPPSLADFLMDITKYQFTISVIARGVTKNARIEVDWTGKWDTVRARSA
jgi:hypothetical protein